MTSKGGQFSGMMEAQSKTTSGLFSTLKDTFNEVFLTLGQPINDALRPLIEQAIGLVAKLTPMAAEAGKRIKEAVQFVVAVFQSGQVSTSSPPRSNSGSPPASTRWSADSAMPFRSSGTCSPTGRCGRASA